MAHRRKLIANSGALSEAEASLYGTDKKSAARRARAELSLRVRNDWEFEWDGQADIQGRSTDATVNTSAERVPPLNLPYRLRSYSSASLAPTNSRAADSSTTSPTTTAHSATDSQSPQDASSASSPLEAGTPPKKDSTELTLSSIPTREKRQFTRKRRLLEEEMSWNTGLAHWTAQRDAWSTARVERRPPAQERHDDTDPDVSNEGEEREEEEVINELVPVHPPVLPQDHPVRSVINPSTYLDIYSKIVVKGQTPSVPINLVDMTGTLVKGWKAEGEWPPKVTPQIEKPVARRKRRSLRGLGFSVKADHSLDNVTGERHENAAEEGNVDGDTHSESISKRSRAGSVKGKFKKVLGFGHVPSSLFGEDHEAPPASSTAAGNGS